MRIPHLVFEQHTPGGEHLRIWRQQDGGFSFEHLEPTGKGITISCTTLGEALMLWRRLKERRIFQSLTPPADEAAGPLQGVASSCR